MIDEERRQKISDEIMDALDLYDDVPAYAMTRKEFREMLNIGDKALNRAFKEIELQGRLNRSKVCRKDSLGRSYHVEVFWFDGERNTLHKSD